MKDIDEIRRGNMLQLERSCSTVGEAAELAGMSQAQWSNLRSGALDSKTGKPRGMRKETARKIEIGHGKPIGWLDIDHQVSPSSDTATGKNSASSQHDNNKETAVIMKFPKPKIIDNYVTFEVFDVRMSAGPGALAVDRPDVTDHLTVLRTWAHEKIGSANSDNIKLVTCCGVSMQPTIEDGTLMFVDVSVRDFRGDGIYCLAWRDMLMVKRLIADPVNGTLRVVSDNPDKEIYKDQVLSGSQIDELQILGRVVRWIDIGKP